jgi:hypothetical protein
MLHPEDLVAAPLPFTGGTKPERKGESDPKCRGVTSTPKQVLHSHQTIQEGPQWESPDFVLPGNPPYRTAKSPDTTSPLSNCPPHPSKGPAWNPLCL